jgi:hypothetical protein
MNRQDPKSMPELLNGVLQRKMLSRKFVLQGACPNCREGLKLVDKEIDQSHDFCPSCAMGFRIPAGLADRWRATLQAEQDAAEARHVQVEEARKQRQQAALERKTAAREESQRYAQGDRIRETNEEEEARRLKEWENQVAQMKVTTGDLKEAYEVIGPVYFSVSNKGFFFNQLGALITKYQKKLAELKAGGAINGITMDWSFLYGQFSVGQSQFDSAFFVAVEELKLRAGRVGGDAIVFMRQDIDIDTTGMQYFYLQMYGTAVRLKNPGSPVNEVG